MFLPLQDYECPLGLVKCGNSSCVYGYMCDGYNDCPSGSDEDPGFCKSYECPEGYIKCSDGLQCVYNTSMCDGYPQCKGRTTLLLSEFLHSLKGCSILLNESTSCCLVICV